MTDSGPKEERPSGPRRPDRGWTMGPQAYRILSSAAVGLLALGTIVYHWLEDWSWIDSFYFSAVAVTTVGFGDLVPTTNPAKLFTVFYVISGIGIVTSFINERLQRHAQRIAAGRGG